MKRFQRQDFWISGFLFRKFPQKFSSHVFFYTFQVFPTLFGHKTFHLPRKISARLGDQIRTLDFVGTSPKGRLGFFGNDPKKKTNGFLEIVSLEVVQLVLMFFLVFWRVF